MQEYKLSKYNELIEVNGKTYLWNTFSDAIIQLDEEWIRFIHKYENGKILNNKPSILTLINNGCVVKENCIETAKITLDETVKIVGERSNKIKFTIAPGLGCNYRCIYCFEGDIHPNIYMNASNIDNISKFIIKNLESNKNLNTIHITWFGGEPLLYLEQMQKLSNKVLTFCNKNGIKYTAGIITNGRFLTEDIFNELLNIKISNIQVTLDGLKDLYIKMKRANESDYDQVIRNIVAASRVFKIIVRLNISHTNIKEAYKVTDYLLGDLELSMKIKMYLAFLRDYNLSPDEEKQIHRQHNIDQMNYVDYVYKNYSVKDLGYMFPRRHISSCSQISLNNYVIGPKEEIYQCEHYIGDKNSAVGSINEGKCDAQKLDDFIHCKHKPKCLECKFMPICLGGCKDDLINNRFIIDCESYIKSLMQLKKIEIMSKYQT